MKVGNLVMYNLGSMPDSQGYKDIAIVVKKRTNAAKESVGIRSYLVYFPHYNEWLNVWEHEYRVVS